MLRLTTFGGVALRRDWPDDRGGAVGEQQPAKRGLALLVLLAAAPDAGVSRDSLLAHLWPESERIGREARFGRPSSHCDVSWERRSWWSGAWGSASTPSP